jgi:predicted permease
MLIGGDFSAVNLAPDARVLAYVISISLVSGILFGISPAWQFARRDVASALKDDGAGLGSLSGSKLRSLLVAAQVTVSVLLLAIAGLLGRGLIRSQAADPGFETRSVFTVAGDFAAMGSDPAKAFTRKRRLLEKLREQPEFTASLGNRPFSGTWTPPIVAGNSRGRTLASYASEGYFETLAIPLLRGRLFTSQEARGAGHQAVVSESTARRFWPDEDPLGKTFALDMDFRGSLEEFEVIGIVKDIRFANLTRLDPAHVYLPAGTSEKGSFADLLVRVQGDRQRALTAVETTVAANDQDLLPGLRLVNLDDGAVRLQRALSRIFATMAAILAILALALAGVGIYGVISYLVSRRTREIGIRMALGANAAAVWKDVLFQGLRPVLTGILLGAAGAAVLSAILHQTLIFPGSMDFLYGVSFYDPLTFASLVCFVLAFAALASAVPARRAVRVDPAVALRYE